VRKALRYSCFVILSAFVIRASSLANGSVVQKLEMSRLRST
jgi:hypothetical protein